MVTTDIITIGVMMKYPTPCHDSIRVIMTATKQYIPYITLIKKMVFRNLFLHHNFPPIKKNDCNTMNTITI